MSSKELPSGRRMSQFIFLCVLRGAVTVQVSEESVRYVTTMMQGVGLQIDWLVPLSSDETGCMEIALLQPSAGHPSCCNSLFFGSIQSVCSSRLATLA